jgi:hypothetical protein
MTIYAHGSGEKNKDNSRSPLGMTSKKGNGKNNGKGNGKNNGN